MPTTTDITLKAWQLEGGVRIKLNLTDSPQDISEMRVEFVKRLYDEVLLVGEIFNPGACGSFQPGYLTRPNGQEITILGTF